MRLQFNGSFAHVVVLCSTWSPFKPLTKSTTHSHWSTTQTPRETPQSPLHKIDIIDIHLVNRNGYWCRGQGLQSEAGWDCHVRKHVSKVIQNIFCFVIISSVDSIHSCRYAVLLFAYSWDWVLGKSDFPAPILCLFQRPTLIYSQHLWYLNTQR